MKATLGVAAVALGFLGGAQAQQLVEASGEPEPVVRAIDPAAHADGVVLEECPAVATRPPWPVNDNGMTYGAGAAADAYDPGPDLVAAHGTDGRCGFVRATDRDPGASTLQGALASPARRGGEVPLYDRDGVTVIGVFLAGAPADG